MIAQDIPHVAEYLLKKYGLVDKGWRFAWDDAKRRAGCCKYATKTITLSRNYVRLNVQDILDDIIDTVLHEIAHALAPGKGHGPEWKAACEVVGARPVRCYDSSLISMPSGRYSATCSGCSRTYYRYKKPKKYTIIYCIKCGPDLGKLTYVDTKVTQGTVCEPLPTDRIRT